jgi:hypothetical protein
MPLLGDGSMDSVVVFTTYDSIRCRMQKGGYQGDQDESGGKAKNAGLKAATLISVSSPVSQVLW